MGKPPCLDHPIFGTNNCLPSSMDFSSEAQEFLGAADPWRVSKAKVIEGEILKVIIMLLLCA